MSLLVTTARYQVITGDTTTATASVTAAIEDATALLADELGRPDALKSEERTETMQVGDGGQLRPLAVPVTVCAGYTFDTAAIFGGAPDSVAFRGVFPDDLPNTVAVTYSGGWVERSANPSATNRLPTELEYDIAWAAHALVHPGLGAAVPVGATSVSLGDAAVSFGAGGAPARGEAGVTWSRKTLRWRRRLP